MDKAQRIAELILAQLKDELDEPGAAELQNWISQSPDNKALYQQVTNPEQLQQEVMAFYASRGNILKKIKGAISIPKVIPLWKKMVAAASILLMLGLGAYFSFFDKTKKQDEIVSVPAKDVEAPKVTKAMITLADGRQISIDSLHTLTQGDVTITKTADGIIVYSRESGVGSHQIQYNTLSNPRGSKVIDMTLSDGSRVWLNAGSSITYPVSFIESERKVTMSGEAYFEISTKYEVRSTKKQPFIVKKGDLEVEVLGTHFNVKAYEDEGDVKVTLLEGSVKVMRDAGYGIRDEKKLKPGQQVSSKPNSPLTIHHSPDLEEVMAWKNGLFSFESADLKTIMKELARWYDLEVNYETGSSEKFRVKISRQTNLSTVFRIMEETGVVQFNINGRNITVK